jgi:hypothetical protein
LTNRVDRIEKSGGGGGGGVGAVSSDELSSANGASYDNIVDDTTFIGKVVDNILTKKHKTRFLIIKDI